MQSVLGMILLFHNNLFIGTGLICRKSTSFDDLGLILKYRTKKRATTEFNIWSCGCVPRSAPLGILQN